MLVVPQAGTRTPISTKDAAVQNQNYNVLQKISANSIGRHSNSLSQIYHLPSIARRQSSLSNSNNDVRDNRNSKQRMSSDIDSKPATFLPKITSSENTVPTSASTAVTVMTNSASVSPNNKNARISSNNNKNNKKANTSSDQQDMLMPSTVKPPLLNQSANDSKADNSTNKSPAPVPESKSSTGKQKTSNNSWRNSSLSSSKDISFDSSNQQNISDTAPPTVTVTKKKQEIRLPLLMPLSSSNAPITPSNSVNSATKNNYGRKCKNGSRVTFSRSDSQDAVSVTPDRHSTSPINNNNNAMLLGDVLAAAAAGRRLKNGSKSEPVTCLATPLPYLAPRKPVMRSGGTKTQVVAASTRNRNNNSKGSVQQQTQESVPQQKASAPPNINNNNTQVNSKRVPDSTVQHRSINPNTINSKSKQTLLNPAPTSVLAEFDDQFKRLTALYMETYRLLEKC